MLCVATLGNQEATFPDQKVSFPDQVCTLSTFGTMRHFFGQQTQRPAFFFEKAQMFLASATALKQSRNIKNLISERSSTIQSVGAWMNEPQFEYSHRCVSPFGGVLDLSTSQAASQPTSHLASHPTTQQTNQLVELSGQHWSTIRPMSLKPSPSSLAESLSTQPRK